MSRIKLTYLIKLILLFFTIFITETTPKQAIIHFHINYTYLIYKLRLF